MGHGIFIIGTDTDVGKTFISAAVAYILNKNGRDVAYYKPVQSGIELDDGSPALTDTDFIGQTALLPPDRIYCSYGFISPVSPHLASEQEYITIEPDRIISTCRRLLDQHDYTVVEGAGGIAVPIVRNSFMAADLIQSLDIPALLVARTGVGTINHTLLTVEYARNRGIDLRAVIFNGFTDKPHEVDNIAVIKEMTGLPVLAVFNRIETGRTENQSSLYRSEFTDHLDYNTLAGLFGCTQRSRHAG